MIAMTHLPISFGTPRSSLAERNLPARAVVTPDPRLAGLPWHDTALEIRSGMAEDSDPVGVSGSLRRNFRTAM